MKNIRNIITVLALLTVVAWYGGRWVYTNQYKAPRAAVDAKIVQYETAIEQNNRQIEYMKNAVAANRKGYYFYRSFPRSPNAVQSYYPIWLREAAESCEFTSIEVQSDRYAAIPYPQNFQVGIQYRYRLTGEASMEQLSRFLFEFYWTSYLHRISAINIAPIEQSDRIEVSIRIEGITIRPVHQNDPYPMLDRFAPQIPYRVLASGPFRTYEVIGKRDFLQFARGGLDRADHTKLMMVLEIGGVWEIRLKDETTGQTIIANIGDTISVGSFNAKLKEVTSRQDVVFEENNRLWLLSNGEMLSSVYAIPPELGGE